MAGHSGHMVITDTGSLHTHGHYIHTVILDTRSLQTNGHSRHRVILDTWSLHTHGHYRHTVIPDTWSLHTHGHSRHTVIPDTWSFQTHGHYRHRVQRLQNYVVDRLSFSFYFDNLCSADTSMNLQQTQVSTQQQLSKWSRVSDCKNHWCSCLLVPV